jgi:hypothetical protein
VILLIDANTVLPLPTTGQSFEPIPRRNGEFLEVTNAVELCQLTTGDGPERTRAGSARAPAVHPVEDVFGSSIRERTYHGMYYNGSRSAGQAAIDVAI